MSSSSLPSTKLAKHVPTVVPMREATTVPPMFNSPAVQLVKDGDKVVGCICEADGKYVQYNAAKGVVLCTGGLKTDINFECLDADGKPIKGLYALGNCMGDITAVDYPINVAGNSHGRCITYGYLLGKDLAK